MGLLHFIILMAIAGLALWGINTYLPMPEKIKTLLNVVVIIVLVIYSIFFVLSFLPASWWDAPHPFRH